MTLELNKPYLVKRVASNGGVLHYLPMDGFCDDIALDAPVLAKRVASNAGVLHYLIGNQQLAADGKLTLNKPYLAKRVASNAGVLHYLVAGKQCEVGDPTVCGIVRCCTLNASVRIKLTADPTWTDWVDVDLVCGASISYQDGAACYNLEDEGDTFAYLFDVITSGKDTLDSPEPYDIVTSSGTRSCKSVFWRGDFEAGGKSYQLIYYVIETHEFQTSPTTTTIDNCYEGFLLLEWATSGPAFDIYGPHWNGIGGGLGTVPTWSYTLTFDPPYEGDCPEGYGTSNEFDDDGCSFGVDGCAEIDIVDPCEEE